MGVGVEMAGDIMVEEELLKNDIGCIGK